MKQNVAGSLTLDHANANKSDRGSGQSPTHNSFSNRYNKIDRKKRAALLIKWFCYLVELETFDTCNYHRVSVHIGGVDLKNVHFLDISSKKVTFAPL